MASATASSSKVTLDGDAVSGGPKVWSFNSPKLISFSETRADFVRLPDIAFQDALLHRLITPRGRNVRAVREWAQNEEDDHGSNARRQRARVLVQNDPQGYTVPEARHASLFLAYLHEHDSSSAGLALVNDVDFEPCPSWDFAYTDRYIKSPFVKQLDRERSNPTSSWGKTRTFDQIDQVRPEDLQGTRRGCACGTGDGDEGETECDPKKCDCRKFQALLDSYVPSGPDYAGEFAYHSDGTLRQEILLWDGWCVAECTDACACGEDCPNRVVQKGRQVPLEIFKTNKCGWGIRTRNALKAGTFITCYAGEILGNVEAEERAQAYNETVGTTYLMDIESFLGNQIADSLAKRAFPDMPAGTQDEFNVVSERWQAECPESGQFYLTVDASLWGNISRYFNHSCDPNMRIYYIYTDPEHDIARPKMAFFTTRDVAAHEELRFSYNAPPTQDEADSIVRQLDAKDDDILYMGEARTSSASRRTPGPGATRAGPSPRKVAPTSGLGSASATAQSLFAKRCHCGAASCSGVMFDDSVIVTNATSGGGRSDQARANESPDDDRTSSRSTSRSREEGNRSASEPPSAEHGYRDSRADFARDSWADAPLSTAGMDFVVEIPSSASPSWLADEAYTRSN